MSRSTQEASTLEVYCIAIGGTGMAPLACLMQEQGHRVRGADGPLYPPMSLLLEGAGIRPHEGFDAAHLHPPPDLVVVGNAVPRHNPEAQEVERLGLPRISMPQAVARFCLEGRQPLVVAGTHGKTTTTSMAAWVWTFCGTDPGYLIGGMPRDLPRSFHLGTGRRFVIEGDEYNAAYFDRGAKFLHYQPQTVILTSVEHDHADLYDRPEKLLEAYRQLLRLLPEDGHLVACGDSEQVREVATAARCRVTFYGLLEGNQVRPLGGVREDASGSRFQVSRRLDGAAGEPEEIHLPLPGAHNVSNALGVWAAAMADGLEGRRVAEALGSLRGVARRLEELGTAAEVTVVDDFAHHPTAVEASLNALRRRYPGRRLVALFEPRSLTAAREMLHSLYLQAFSVCDRALLAPAFHAQRLKENERVDLSRLASELADRGVAATACESVEEVLTLALAEVEPGDVLVTMSSGAFAGMPRRLLEALAGKEALRGDP